MVHLHGYDPEFSVQGSPSANLGSRRSPGLTFELLKMEVFSSEIAQKDLIDCLERAPDELVGPCLAAAVGGLEPYPDTELLDPLVVRSLHLLSVPSIELQRDGERVPSLCWFAGVSGWLGVFS